MALVEAASVRTEAASTAAGGGGSVAAAGVTVTEAGEAEVAVGTRLTTLRGRRGGNWEGSMDCRGGKGRPGRSRGGSEDRGGTVAPSGWRAPVPASDIALRSGSGRLRLGRFGSRGRPAGRGIRPGSVAAGLKPAGAGLSGVRGESDGLLEEGSRGTVGKPVCSSVGMAGGAELMDKLDRESSRPAGTTGAAGGGVTAESWTSVNPSFRGLTGSLGEFPGKLIFFPSSKGRVGILWRYP